MYVQPKLISRRLKSEKSKMFKVHSRYIGLMSCAELNHLLLNWTLKSLASPASQAPPSPQSGVSWNSRSRPFPRIKASDSLSWIMGMDFFIPFPFPNFGNGLFNSLPVPELWEWNFLFPFPFLNPQKSFPLTPANNRWPWAIDFDHSFKIYLIYSSNKLIH